MPDNWIPETRHRLALRRARKPDTKAGQLRALWPEIKAALDDGQSIKTIRRWLEEDAGIMVSAGSLTSYISRNRRREAAQRTEEAARSVLRVHDHAAQAGKNGAPATSQRINPAPMLAGDPVEDAVSRTVEMLRKQRFDIREIHLNGDPRNAKLI